VFAMKRRAKAVVNAIAGAGEAAGEGEVTGVDAIRGGKRVVEEIKHPPGRNETTLRLAARDGDWKMAYDLLQAKVSLEKEDENGQCALHYACLGGQEKLIRLLLEFKGNVDAINKTGETPLHVAAFMGQALPVRVLIKAKASGTVQDNGGQTPLHIACRLGHQPAVEQLILARCDPNVVDTCHQTALHISSWKGHAEVTMTVLDHPDIKIDPEDIRARTPAERAEEHGCGGPGTAFHEMIEGARIKKLEKEAEEQNDDMGPGALAPFKVPW